MTEIVDVYEIGGKDYPRVRYGAETDGRPPAAGRPCHDCSVSPGECHAPGCDWEQCPKCGGQSISCWCDDVDGLD
jgi:hypothetical protein